MPFDQTLEVLSAEDETRQRVWDLIEEIGVCMLASHDGESVRSRPMSRRLRFGDNSCIYFLVDVASGEIVNDVCLTFADMSRGEYLSLTGEARLLDDRPLIRALWRGSDGAFWETPEAESLRVLQVSPRAAQFWDRRGELLSAVEMSAAACEKVAV